MRKVLIGKTFWTSIYHRGLAWLILWIFVGNFTANCVVVVTIFNRYNRYQWHDDELSLLSQFLSSPMTSDINFIIFLTALKGRKHEKNWFIAFNFIATSKSRKSWHRPGFCCSRLFWSAHFYWRQRWQAMRFMRIEELLLESIKVRLFSFSFWIFQFIFKFTL